LLRLLLLVVTIAGSAAAQQAPAVAQAEALRTAGRFEQAAQVLREHLRANPDDGDAARMLAQTLYWMKDVRGAAAEYQAALQKHPADVTTRLQYARMLVETGAPARAKDLLIPLPEPPPQAQSEAETLLGLIAYWDGDYSTARTRFAAAVRANPSNTEAKQRLDEIDSATSPWLRVSAAAWHDDQPLDRGSAEIEAGWFPAPLTSVAARFTPARYAIDDASATMQAADVTVNSYVPTARLETQLRFGVTSGSVGPADDVNWTGGASAAVRAANAVKVGGRVSRFQYLYTVASVDTPVMVNSAAAFARLDRRGWLGEAQFERQRYPDDNAATTEYGWLLAPVVHAPGGTVQAGYAISSSDADESRFTLAHPTQPYAPGDPRFDASGVYVPYYTPDSLLTQSVIAAVAARGARASFHGSVSYGVYAHDNAPFFDAVLGTVTRMTAPRSFHPWSARAALSIPAGRASIEPQAEVGRTAFYSWASAGVQITWRFRDAHRAAANAGK
jgi:uncharacterized protein (TIGR02996 family)